MTSKLKCPVCNHKLYQTASEPATYCCLYKDCASDFKFAGSKELWQALIQSQKDLEESQQATLQNAQTVLEIHKDLEIARKALKSAKARLELINNSKFANLNNVLQIQSQCEVLKINKALKQIEHKD